MTVGGGGRGDAGEGQLAGAVAADEVARLKKSGIPAIPRPMPSTATMNTADDVPVTQMHRRLLAEPSAKVIDAAEQVLILESELKALALRREREEQLDWFRQRERQRRHFLPHRASRLTHRRQ